MARVEAGAWERGEGCLRLSPTSPPGDVQEQLTSHVHWEVVLDLGWGRHRLLRKGDLDTLHGRFFGMSLWPCVTGWRADIWKSVSGLAPGRGAQGRKLPKQTLEKGQGSLGGILLSDGTPRRRNNWSSVWGSGAGGPGLEVEHQEAQEGQGVAMLRGGCGGQSGSRIGHLHSRRQN